jgi:integrase
LSKRNDNVWIVEYYLQNDANEFVRKRKRVKPIKPTAQRLELAKTIITDLTTKLRQGWNPERKETDANGNMLLLKALDKYRSFVDDKYQVGNFRYDSYRSYKSMINLFKTYVGKNNKNATLHDFTENLCMNYLNHVLFQKKLSNTYVNNCRNHLRIFGNFLIDHNLIQKNPATKIKTLKNEDKARTIIPDARLKDIFTHLESYNKTYYLICLLTYLCFIRRTEITKLKVSDVNIEESVILLRSDVSKNKNEDIITIPNIILKLLKDHIKNIDYNLYLFSSDRFLPGSRILKPKRITIYWNRIKTILDLKSSYHFYSLKDTGITRLFYLNIPIVKIKNQARHTDIKTTQLYVPKSKLADDEIKNLKLF